MPCVATGHSGEQGAAGRGRCIVLLNVTRYSGKGRGGNTRIRAEDRRQTLRSRLPLR
jgi:hypothetical protein